MWQESTDVLLFLEFMGGVAWPSLLGGLICLVDSFNDLYLSRHVLVRAHVMVDVRFQFSSTYVSVLVFVLVGRVKFMVMFVFMLISPQVTMPLFL